MTYDDQNVARALRPPSPAPWVLLFLVIAGACGGSAWLYDKLGETRVAATAAAGKAAEAESARAAQAERAQKLEAEKAELLADKAALAAAKEELSRDVEAKSGELAELKGTADKLQDKMKAEIAKGDILLSQGGGKLRVDLVDKVLFDSGEAQISKRGEEVLARVGTVLAQIEDKQIQVSGHTDDTRVGEKLAAQFPSNWELSTARAVNVVRFLAEKAGVPAERLAATGYGEYHPIASNKTTAGRRRNRRIEILLTPALDPKLMARGKLDKSAGKNAVAEAPARRKK
jgi:chemotaxis protein MotB